MSYEKSDLPFARGQTFYGSETIVPGATAGDDLEGREFVVKDTINGTAYPVRLKIVRNKSGFTLLPKYQLRYQATYFGRRVDGYTNQTAQYGPLVVDEAYAQSGAPIRDGDLFYAVVEGPCAMRTSLDGLGQANIAEGARLVALTAVTSGATTAGRVIVADYVLTQAPLANQINNAIGVAMSARTTAQTNADVLVLVNQRF